MEQVPAASSKAPSQGYYAHYAPGKWGQRRGESGLGLGFGEATLTCVFLQGESPTRPSELQPPAWGPLLR